MDFETDHLEQTGAEESSWLDSIGSFFSGIGESISDFFTPDALGTTGVEPMSTEALSTTESGSAADLPNQGFYQSLPGMDATTGQLLDDTYALIDDVNAFGEETFGEQEWDEALVLAQSDPYGFAEGIETPSELQARFAHDDAQREASFRDWQDRQQAIADADAEIAEADRLNHESDWLMWNTDQLLKLG